MECINCKTIISIRSIDQICVNCRFDDKVMISLTEVKMKFKLTEEELDKAKLFKIVFTIKYNVGTKYLRNQVIDLAGKLTENLPDNDKRKMVYMKYKDIMDEIKQIDKELDIKINNVKQITIDLLAKTDIIVNDVIKAKMSELTKIYIKNDNMTAFQMAMQLCNDIIKFSNLLKDRSNRQKMLNDLIIQKFGGEYINDIKLNYAYTEYIKHNTLPLGKTFSVISRQLQEKVDKQNRRQQLNDLIKSRFDEKFINIVQSYKEYNGYINNSNPSLIFAFKYISEQLQKIIDKENRKKQMDKLIDNTFSKKYRIMAKRDTYYGNFIENNSGTSGSLEINFSKIEAKINNLIAKNKRETKLKRQLSKTIKEEYMDIAIESSYYKKYIQNGKEDDFNNTIKLICDLVNEKMKQDFRHDKLNKILNRYGIDINTIVKIDEYKKYIRGIITLKDVIDQVNKMKLEELKQEYINNYIQNKMSQNNIYFIKSIHYNKYMKDSDITLKEFNNFINFNIVRKEKLLEQFYVHPNDVVTIDNILANVQTQITIRRNSLDTQKYIEEECKYHGLDYKLINGNIMQITKIPIKDIQLIRNTVNTDKFQDIITNTITEYEQLKTNLLKTDAEYDSIMRKN